MIEPKAEMTWARIWPTFTNIARVNAKPHWIPAGYPELPKPGSTVLIVWDVINSNLPGGVHVAILDPQFEYGRPKWHLCNGRTISGEQVTHWSPLPTLPERSKTP